MTGELSNREVVWQHEALDRCLNLYHQSNKIVRNVLSDFYTIEKCFDRKPIPIDPNSYRSKKWVYYPDEVHDQLEMALYEQQHTVQTVQVRFLPVDRIIVPPLECLSPLSRIGSLPR